MCRGWVPPFITCSMPAWRVHKLHRQGCYTRFTLHTPRTAHCTPYLHNCTDLNHALAHSSICWLLHCHVVHRKTCYCLGCSARRSPSPYSLPHIAHMHAQTRTHPAWWTMRGANWGGPTPSMQPPCCSCSDLVGADESVHKHTHAHTHTLSPSLPLPLSPSIYIIITYMCIFSSLTLLTRTHIHTFADSHSCPYPLMHTQGRFVVTINMITSYPSSLVLCICWPNVSTHAHAHAHTYNITI